MAGMPPPERPFREYFLRPSRIGRMESAQGAGEAANEVCGDWVRFHLRQDQGRIAAASIQVRGCSATIATASLAAEALEGLDLAAARGLDIADLARSRGATHRDLGHAPAVVTRAIAAALAGLASDCQASGD